MKPTFRQFTRSVVAWAVTGAWLLGFLWVVREAAGNPASLEKVEGFIALLAVTGVVVKDIVEKLFASDD